MMVLLYVEYMMKKKMMANVEIGLFLLVGKLVLNIKDALNDRQIILMYLILKRIQSLKIHINYSVINYDKI